MNLVLPRAEVKCRLLQCSERLLVEAECLKRCRKRVCAQCVGGDVSRLPDQGATESLLLLKSQQSLRAAPAGAEVTHPEVCAGKLLTC